MRLFSIAAAITRANQWLHPGFTRETALLKPFDDPSARVKVDLTQDELEPILAGVVQKLRAGHNIVAIDVGRMDMEDFAFSQHTKGSNVTSFFDKNETLRRLSQLTGRNIAFAEGVQREGEETPSFITNTEKWTGIKNPVTFYALLYDARRINRHAA